ncbi:MAG: hypothetical protein OM95_06765 [Bdellovibrio sp. ArHS]|uniref:PilZ domain-containing protein n=1 Tax=Bdellovibrio sp. ArHS TaxID=1569284 RepID=UPI0005828B3B|nr:PilZ domain-containing protein [Bdellovibrio sp. ArHS]KHD88818.1 MAG: hypothetical protein OM95_06765 [Bdellovibrio sp. ArHS]
MTQTPLKKPTGIYFLAVLFLLAPLGNLAISFAGSGVPHWYLPPTLFEFLKAVTPLDWVWLGLLFLSGILLFKPHKTSWTLAILSLVFVLVVNGYRFSTHALVGDGLFNQTHLVLSSFVTVGVLLLAFYFRFPYLDRRAQWLFPTAHRYEFATRADVVAQDIFEGVTESISVSGARIRLKRDMEASSRGLRFVDVIFPEIRNVKIKSKVVEYHENVLRLKFKDLSRRDRGYLHDWFRSQIETEQKSKG